MHRRWKEVILALVLGLLFPSILFSVSQKKEQDKTKASLQTEPTPAEIYEDSTRLISVLLDDGSVAELMLEDYIVAVVLREMPADFEVEALKAQAVVARTYALRKQVQGGKHSNSAVCTNSACCQGYCLPETFLQDGGTMESLKKVTDAVHATAGEVLVYDNALIEATYFSCSGGMTEDAAAVWGENIPYLVATKSPGEEYATHYVDTVKFTTDEFARKLGLSVPDGSAQWIEVVSYTAGGGVSEIRISDKIFKGTTIRKKLGLRSTAFTISVVGKSVSITTKGFGHRVGMSQYGADAMAVQGNTYEQILAHYYKGTELVTYAQ